MTAASVASPNEKEKTENDPWKPLKDYIDEHNALLIDKNVATKEMTFKGGEIIVDSVRYRLSDLGWRSLCARMQPPTGGHKKPPADYIKHLPMNMQEDIMAYHFAQIPKTRHFMRAKADDNGPFIRAMVSETYQRGRFDYTDFVGIILEDFRAKMPGFRPVAYDAGERIFHAKALSDVVIPDPVNAKLQVGITFMDSEVGAGSVMIRPFVRRSNGPDLFILSDCFKRKHTGAKKQMGMELDTATLQGGVSTDKLRVTRDIKTHIDKLVNDHTSTIEATKAMILEYYDTPLPIENWSRDDKDALFEWVWKRCSAIGFTKGSIKEAVDKLEDYNMKNLWGLFCAMCEVSQHPVQEQQLDDEIKASKVASHLYAILSR